MECTLLSNEIVHACVFADGLLRLGLNAPNISVKVECTLLLSTLLPSRQGFLQEMKNFQVSLDNSSPGECTTAFG